jgi:hypothetical protein
MAGRVHGEVAPSPWVSRFADYQDNAIVLTVNFNNTTRAILNADVERDAGCVFSKLLFGVGPGGVPDATETQLTIAEGPGVIGRGQFVAFGFDKIEDLQTVQITAGR